MTDLDQDLSGQAVLISLQFEKRLRGFPKHGALAQLGERLICIQEVRSSILLGSTTLPLRWLVPFRMGR